jgi:hypothetical protein
MKKREPMDREAADQLILLVLSGEAGDADVRQLREACAEQPEVLDRLVLHASLDRMLPAAVERDAPRFAAEVLARLEPKLGPAAGIRLAQRFEECVQSRLVQPRRFPKRWVAAVALLFVMAGIAAWWFFPEESGTARLARAEAVVWGAEDVRVKPGEGLPMRRLMRIESGLLEIRLSQGFEIVLEGPVAFELLDEASLRLDYGRLVAMIRRFEGRECVIYGPAGMLSAKQARVGVLTENDGATEVHVLDGGVDFSPTAGGQEGLRLKREEAIRIDVEGLQRLGVDAAGFLADLPPAPNRQAGVIHWPFDEPEGLVALNAGKGLAEGIADARLASTSAEGGLPRRVPGRLGGALAFDGRSAFLETDYKGISGTSARSVAMWVRVPRELKVTEGYALIGWGDVSGSGTAWQISINSEENEGPLGCLRAGTGEGAVVGATDLRDGEWHHIAVVMYGGPDASTATHILLYVDGELEETTRQSIREIRTDVGSVNHGIWIGRNLSTSNPQPADAYFFRGEIDEVYLMDSTLDQPAIRRFMEGK